MFKISPDYEDIIQVRLHSIHGKFQQFVKAGSIPTEIDNDYEGNDLEPLFLRSTAKVTQNFYVLIKAVDVIGREETGFAH